VGRQRFADKIADAHTRVERGAGILENHLDLTPNCPEFAACVAGRPAALHPY
jgi:hypothetical protein